MTAARSPDTGRRLGLLLLGYLGAVVAVIVFTPFQFSAPDTDRLLMAPEGSDLLRDLLLNVVLFVPLGFLVERTGRGRFGIGQVVVLGAVASLLIETTQLFLPDRWSTATDLLANSAGAGIGALASAAIRRRLGASASLAGRMFLDLPLLGICWLLLPILWVEALQGPLGAQISLMAAGGFAIAGAGRSNAARARQPAGVLWPLVAGWSVTATLPSLAGQPIQMVFGVATALLACLVGDTLWRHGSGSERRVEPRAVAAIVMALLPWFAIKGLFDVFDPTLPIPFRERILEWLALGGGFTVLGYAFAEWRGRSSRAWPVSAVLPMAVAALVAWPLGRSRLPLILAAAIVAAFGALLFEAQRAHVVASRSQ
jgi:VanZ family protein